MKSVILAAATLAAAMGAVHAQDLAAGEQSFRKCSPCHSVGEDARNKVGPELNGLDGRKSGTVADPRKVRPTTNASSVGLGAHTCV